MIPRWRTRRGDDGCWIVYQELPGGHELIESFWVAWRSADERASYLNAVGRPDYDRQRADIATKVAPGYN